MFLSIIENQIVILKGGLKAVVWTDVFQSCLMYAGVLLIAFKGTRDVGGLGVVLEKNWISNRIEGPK